MKSNWLKPSGIIIIIVALLMTTILSNLRWHGEDWKTTLGSDARGYYATLPATFIYGDLNYGFFEEIELKKYFNSNQMFDYRSIQEGGVTNKFYCGTAIAEAPFFLLGHLCSHINDKDTDGYSWYYMIFISLSGVFYLMLGLIYTNKLLDFYDIKEWHKVIVLVVTVFGTNLFYYAIVEVGTSHIFSFAFVAMFVYFSKLFFTSDKAKYSIILAALLGMIVLIRPINGMIIFSLPFMAGSWEAFSRSTLNLLKRPFNFLLALLLFFGVVSIQLFIYKISVGSFFIYSYTDEGFDFLHPHFIDILFSYKKGLFLYTPMYLLAFVGLWYLWNKSKYMMITWLLFFVMITYILSSWWSWYYGGSFSSRVYVEYLPLFAILIGVALRDMKRRAIYISVISILLVVCQIQTYQYRYYDIHWSDMTKDKYWNVFLRIDRLM